MTDHRRPVADGMRWLRERRLVALGVYVAAFLAWLSMVDRWLPMPTSNAGGAMEVTDPGVPEAMAAGAGPTGWALYLLMWGVMMIAMMYPSSVPLVRLYHDTLTGCGRGGRLLRVGAFLGSYTLLWTAAGVVPLAVNHVIPVSRVATSGAFLAGTLLLLAVYQLSPYKERCLDRCRTPLGFLLTHSRPGVRGAARMGFDHGTYCLGCCWALFAFMVVVGTMNLVWMAAITVVLSLERTVAWGDHLARAVGVAAGVAGVAVLVVTIAGGA
jgi:predicted metal-binding membrane protein